MTGELRVAYVVIEEVITEAILLEETKAFIGIDFNDFDGLIESIISGCRLEVEAYTGLSIGERTIQLTGDFLDPEAYMPFEPIQLSGTTGIQRVGYSAKTLPGNIRLAILNMVQIAFSNRDKGLDFTSGLRLLDRSRRRVGL